ncbi:MAG: hypothetical protein AAFR54_11550 [Planctomycetota bacterium]
MTDRSPQRAPRTAVLTLVPLLGSLLLGACAATEGSETSFSAAQRLCREGQYERAAAASVALLEGLSEQSELRPQIEALQAEISVASGLEAARELSLVNRDVEALQIVRELTEAHPTTPVIGEWDARIRAKLSVRWFEIAREAVATEDFDLARIAYAKSVEYQPEASTIAAELLSSLDRIEEYRADVAEQLYYRGVRHFTDLEIAEAVNRFGAVRKYAPGNEAAERRETEAKRVMAQARVDAANALVAEDLFAAAAKEYARAAELDPTSEEIATNLAALRIEAEVQETMTRADGMILRREFDAAAKALGEALERTTLQRDLVEADLERLGEARAADRYSRALDLEHDFQFERALESYGEILETREFYRDVRARVDSIEGYVADAERLYAEAAAAEDGAAKLALYRQIEVFWPDYRDIQKRIAALAKP